MLAVEIKQHVVRGNATETDKGVRKLVENGMSADQIIDKVLIPAMAIVGDKFKNNEIFVPEMLIAARAMDAGLKVLEPIILLNGRKYLGKAVIGTVSGDMHDIGKKLVSTMLRGAGWEIIDLGVDVSPQKFVTAVQEHRPAILCMSALLTTTLKNMKSVINLLEQEGLRAAVKVVVGGAPVTQHFADDIGADGYASDAGAAVGKCAGFIN